MRKIINDAENVVTEMLDGFVGAYDKYYEKHPLVNGILGKNRRKNKVVLVIGGGSGHEPIFAGFVGNGLADAAACGGVFASPDPGTIYETAKAVDQGQGIVFVYGCYAGDNLNFDMAEELLKGEGIETAHIRVRDDVASAPRERYDDRRGIAGDVFVIKIAGAACDAKVAMKEVVRITEKACRNTKSIGIATGSAQLPGLETPVFELGVDEIEYGMGLHGEKGILRTKWESADQLTEKMYHQILMDSDLESGDEVCVLVNGLGATTIMELAIVYRKVKSLLNADGIKVFDVDLNSYCTSQEMGGFSITLMKLDEELKAYYKSPCQSPYYVKGNITDIVESTAEESLSEGWGEDEVKAMLIYVADKIIHAKAMLTEIDSAIGDGDHGIGMERGMKSLKAELAERKKTGNVYDIFETAGKAMLMSMGGASGVLFGSMFLEGAREMRAQTLSAGALSEWMRKGLLAIQKRGKAEPGDKTMVDALAPAVEAMSARCNEGMLPMLRCAEKAAEQGVEHTKLYQARFGRAKSLQERALGFPDAGAMSVCLIVQGMREFAEDISGILK